MSIKGWPPLPFETFWSRCCSIAILDIFSLELTRERKDLITCLFTPLRYPTSILFYFIFIIKYPIIHYLYLPAHAQRTFFKMTSSDMPHSKFLSRPSELGVVAVGFSGGQVCPNLSFTCNHVPPNFAIVTHSLTNPPSHSANQESMLHHLPSSRAVSSPNYAMISDTSSSTMTRFTPTKSSSPPLIPTTVA